MTSHFDFSSFTFFCVFQHWCTQEASIFLHGSGSPLCSFPGEEKVWIQEIDLFTMTHGPKVTNGN